MGNICEAAAEELHEANYAGNLQFFTRVVTLLESRSERSHWLVEERSRALLGRAFSRVFSYLQGRDPHFDFDAAISPSWSIHSGCGTSNYTFIWAMGGEDQAFDDMDVIPTTDLK